MENNSNLFMSLAPHISTNKTTKKIMLDVIIALIPAGLAGILFFGFYSLIIMLVTVASAVLAEHLYCKITKQETSIHDLSAVVTGLILAYNMPPTISLHIPIIGAFFAIMIVKMLFGGLGKNFANPAIVGRIFLTLAFAGAMNQFVAPIDLTKGGMELFKYFPELFDPNKVGSIAALSGATPLAELKAKNPNAIPLLQLFLGHHGGVIGETSALALLIGGLYLLIKKVIDWKIPFFYTISLVLMVLMDRGDKSYQYVLPSLLTGGFLFGAIFMATDYASSPNSKWAIIVYAILLGIFTEMFRRFGSMSGGVSFSILLGNIIAPLLDKILYPRAFGYKSFKKAEKIKKQEEKQKLLKEAATVAEKNDIKIKEKIGGGENK